MTTIYKNMIPVEKRLVFDDNQRITHHYISFFESNVNGVADWKMFDPMLTGKTTSPYRFDEKTWQILNFTKWIVVERDNRSVGMVEAMVW
jgi:hypothetical protein